jgi:hypothetical protein
MYCGGTADSGGRFLTLATISCSGRGGETERRCRGTIGASREPLGGSGGSGERRGVGSREEGEGDG